MVFKPQMWPFSIIRNLLVGGVLTLCSMYLYVALVQKRLAVILDMMPYSKVKLNSTIKREKKEGKEKQAWGSKWSQHELDRT